MQLKEERSMSNFVKDCINGKSLLSNIDDYIDQWHDGDGDEPLYNYLGMTKKEYNLFVQDEKYLSDIIRAERENADIVSLIKDNLDMRHIDGSLKNSALKNWLQDKKSIGQ